MINSNPEIVKKCNCFIEKPRSWVLGTVRSTIKLLILVWSSVFAAHTMGLSDTLVVKVQDLTFSLSAESGSTLIIFDNGLKLGEAYEREDLSGSFTFTASGLSEGIHKISAQSVDAAGNKSAISKIVEVIVDLTKPRIEKFNIDGIGVANAIDSKNFRFSGITSGVENNQLVTIRVGTKRSSAKVKNNKFSGVVDLSEETEGTVVLSATVTDLAGNVSEVATDAVIKDTTAPVAPAILNVIGFNKINNPPNLPKNSDDQIIVSSATSTNTQKIVRNKNETEAAVTLKKIISKTKQSDPTGTLLKEKTPMPRTNTVKFVEKVNKGDTLSSLFQRRGVDAGTLLAIVRMETRRLSLSRLYPGENFEFIYQAKELIEVSRIISPLERITAVKTESGWKIERKIRKPEVKSKTARSIIESSLFVSAMKSGIPDAVTLQMVEIFGSSVDFVYDIQPGDSFNVSYEQYFADGKLVGNGPIRVADLVNRGKHILAFRYTKSNGETGYYDENGVSLKQAFLRAPLNFRRVSSQFSSARKHPVLGTMRKHTGIDYAAPTGTKVFAAGKGRIIQKSIEGGYGKIVSIRHANKIVTRYAHLSRFGPIKIGQSVSQGDLIGFVGSTGLSTGPHLHYEFLINKVPKNPRVAISSLPKPEKLEPNERTNFKRQIVSLTKDLDETMAMRQVALAFEQ